MTGAAPRHRPAGVPDELVAWVLDRTFELGAVPAPPRHERERAALVRDWWLRDGLEGVTVDEAGNVWGRVRAGGGQAGRPAQVVCAHLDTVFPAEVPHVYRRDGDRVHGPGVGDDTVGVAALSALATLLPERTRHPVWVLASVGEEGEGNLAGARSAFRSSPAPIGAMVAVEGNYFGRVNLVGVGSVRWRVTLSGPGGHAWEQADRPSAIHAAAAAIRALLAAADAGGRQARTSVNVGLVGGGEAINARARACWFQVDLRADDPAALEALERAARAAIGSAARDGSVEARFEELGRRPSGRIEPSHPLVRHAVEALRRAGEEARFTAASTDANAAYAAGVPAITVGVTTGGGEHTEREWIGVGELARGLAALADTIAGYDQEEW